MKVLVAPNSMKGSLSAFDFADIVEKAFTESAQQFIVKKLPVADGGDFTGEVMARALNAKTVFVEVQNPVGEIIKSKFAISGTTAIIEMADASGMKLMKRSRLNPMKTSSFGTGQLIRNALEQGCTEILLAIGGSATVDGGMGMMEALGFRFFDKNSVELTGNGGNLSKVRFVRKPSKLPNADIKIICDVDNLLLGEEGAAAFFGPQKGATLKMVAGLESGLRNWAEIIGAECDRRLENVEGSGAAGGVAVPLMAFFNAEIVRGANFVLNRLNFEKYIKWADVVVTGEGKIDAQTLRNKAPFAVAQQAAKLNKPVFAICGIFEKGEELPFNKILSFVTDTVSEAYAIKHASSILYQTSVVLAKTILMGENIDI